MVSNGRVLTFNVSNSPQPMTHNIRRQYLRLRLLHFAYAMFRLLCTRLTCNSSIPSWAAHTFVTFGLRHHDSFLPALLLRNHALNSAFALIRRCPSSSLWPCFGVFGCFACDNAVIYDSLDCDRCWPHCPFLCGVVVVVVCGCLVGSPTGAGSFPSSRRITPCRGTTLGT